MRTIEGLVQRDWRVLLQTHEIQSGRCRRRMALVSNRGGQAASVCHALQLPDRGRKGAAMLVRVLLQAPRSQRASCP